MPPQVSRRLGVAVQTVYTWIRSGELDACNLAGVGTVRPRYRISLAALDAFLKCRSVSPPHPRCHGVPSGRCRQGCLDCSV